MNRVFCVIVVLLCRAQQLRGESIEIDPATGRVSSVPMDGDISKQAQNIPEDSFNVLSSAFGKAAVTAASQEAKANSSPEEVVVEPQFERLLTALSSFPTGSPDLSTSQETIVELQSNQDSSGDFTELATDAGDQIDTAAPTDAPTVPVSEAAPVPSQAPTPRQGGGWRQPNSNGWRWTAAPAAGRGQNGRENRTVPPNRGRTETEVSEAPSEIPTEPPSKAPSDVPASESPSEVPASESPSDVPASEPASYVPASEFPSDVPASESPSQSPSDVPASQSPSDVPASGSPSDVPASDSPSNIPASEPPSDVPASESPSASLAPTTAKPTEVDSAAPTDSPAPSPSPSRMPTMAPTGTAVPSPPPSASPTDSPVPSPSPSRMPSLSPSLSPSGTPSAVPSQIPSDMPSDVPSSTPSSAPSSSPSNAPSGTPSLSLAPSSQPSVEPSSVPSKAPSETPSMAPSQSIAPSGAPSASPSASPSLVPSAIPSLAPSVTSAPSILPSASPSTLPTTTPSESPSKAPSTSPTELPSLPPSVHPSRSPSDTPSMAPSMIQSFPMSTVLTVVLEALDEELSGAPLDTFQQQTKEFIESTMPPLDDATVEITDVEVVSQEIVQLDIANDQNQNALRVRIRINGIYYSSSPPRGFNFASHVGDSFKTDYLQYVYRLSGSDPFFISLVQSSRGSQITNDRSRGKAMLSRGAYVSLILGAVIAVILAIIAFVYAIRNHARVVQQRHGLMLRPTKKFFVEIKQNPSDSTSLTPFDGKSSTGQSLAPPAVQPTRSIITAYDATTQTGDRPMSPAEDGFTPFSPNTMENGGSNRFSIAASLAMTRREEDEEEEEETLPDNEEIGAKELIPQSEKEHRMDLPFSPNTMENGGKKPVLEDESPEKPIEGAVKVQEVEEYDDVTQCLSNVTEEVRTPCSNYQGNDADDGRYESILSVSSGENRNYESSGENRNYESARWTLSSDSDEYDDERPSTGRVSTITLDANRQDPPEGDAQSETSVDTDDRKPTPEALAEYEKQTRGVLNDLYSVKQTSGSPVESSVMDRIVKNARRNSTGGRVPRDPSTINGEFEDDYDGASDYVASDYDSSIVGNEELRLTVSTGGTLGAQAIDGPDYDELTPASLYSAEGLMKGGAFTLGARPLNETEQLQYSERSSHESHSLRREGLYDVFAPSGPIGIVVDTTKEGPSVHSLKSTSPMLGLITPGDLIVGLDNQDTRGMTAASLTKLMAKKAQQSERKITLLAVGDF